MQKPARNPVAGRGRKRAHSTVMGTADAWTVVEDVGPVEFAGQAWGYLQEEAVLNNVLCTLIQARVRRAGEPGTPTDGQHWLRVLGGDGELVGAAAVVPPYGFALMSTMPAGAAANLADHLARVEAELTGADGPVDAANAFAQRFSDATGAPARRGMAQLVFDLEQVRPPAAVAGRPRVATLDDLELVLDWAAAFAAESLPGRDTAEQRAEVTRAVQRRLAAGGDMWLWEIGGEPVSYAHRTRMEGVVTQPTVPLVRVSGVYTPPAHRGHGYASANVAALSQLSLDEGASALLLYTDKANPTSNKIYQEIGYRQVGAAQSWLFDR